MHSLFHAPAAAHRRRPPTVSIVIAAVALLAVALAPLFVFAGHAEAHAVLIRSSPENGSKIDRAPLRVSLYFSEPFVRKLTEVKVTDIDGNQVDTGDLEFDDSDATFVSVGVQHGLEPGLYLVNWSNVSTVDGHPWSGIFQFILLNPDGSVPANAEFNPMLGASGQGISLIPPISDVVLKWVALLATVLAAGAEFWLIAVARPATAFLDEEPAAMLRERSRRVTSLIAYVSLPLAFLAMAVLIPVTVDRFGSDTSVWSYLTSVQTGEYRLAFEVLTLLALAGAFIMARARTAQMREIGLWSFAATSFAALLTFSLTSHGAAIDAGSFWAVTSDFIHTAASALWVGALVMLLPMLLWIRKPLRDAERMLYTANVFDRFSVAAGLSVIAILATGVFNSLVQLPSWDAFVDTAYGRALLAKLALVLPLLGVAGVNAFFLKPRLVEAIDDHYDEKANAVTRGETERAIDRLQRLLPRTIALEAALFVAVFASVAVLTQTSTAKGEIAQQVAAEKSLGGFRDTRDIGDYTVNLEITPNIVGLNQYTLVIRDQNDQPVSGLLQVRLRFTYNDPSQPDVRPPQTELILLERDPGEYTANGAYFSQTGTWQVDANIRREGADDLARSFVVSVAPQQTATTEGGRFALPFTSVNWAQVLGMGIILLGAVVVLYARPLAPIISRGQPAIASAGGAVVIIGGIIAFALSPGSGTAQGNPVKPTEQSIEAGRALFQQNCVVCHGQNGRGDGPQAAALNPAPVDLRLHMPLHRDDQFFTFISEGLPGTAMPAWGDQLSDTDIWNLINFLRAKFSEAPQSRAAP